MSKRSHRVLRVGALLLAVLLPGCGRDMGQSSSGDPSGRVPLELQGKTLAALGDSYASGFGAGDTAVNCGRSDKGWPALLARDAGMEFVNLACAGAKIEDTLRQIDNLPQNVHVVALSVGGNSLGFANSVRLCIYGKCDVSLERARGKLPAARSALEELYTAIHRARPNVAVVLVSDYAPITREGLVCGMLSEGMSRILEVGPGELNAVIAEAALAAGATGAPVQVFTTKGIDEHVLCTEDPWFYDLESGVFSLHPNVTGHAAIAASALAVLQSP